MKKMIDKLKGNKMFNKRNIMIIVGVIVLIFIILGRNNMVKDRKQKEYNALPIKIDYAVTSYYGNIEEILDELNLNFDLVTMGGNCYTGLQRNEFKTDKYGILHTEFRYCASNKTMIFRVYNTTDDQELREPKMNEIPVFDKYGERLGTV